MEWFTSPREHFFYEGEGAMSYLGVMAGVAGIVLGILALMGSRSGHLAASGSAGIWHIVCLCPAG